MDRWVSFRGALGAALLTVTCAACGGGGGGSSPAPTGTSSSTGTGAGSTPSAAPAASPSPSPSAGVGALSGTVASIPQGTYGASASPQTPISGAVVVIGNTPILGATAPPTAPTGDVMSTTNAAGTFVATPPQAAVAPTSAAPFMTPSVNVFNVTTPATGYYVSVFAPGVDGKSAGAPMPFHGFLPVTSGSIGTIRITTASTIEAGFLADVNSFRASVGVGSLIFDELAEEAARLHATDEATQPAYFCHFDRQNVGPTTRFLKLLGLGLDVENIAGVGSLSNTAYLQADAAFEAEGPGGGHYDNLVNGNHQWAGLAQVADTLDGGESIDQELDTPNATSSPTYPISPGFDCPAGTTANGS